MVINRKELLKEAPIVGMSPVKVREHGVSHGLSEAGYDIRIKQCVTFTPDKKQKMFFCVAQPQLNGDVHVEQYGAGRFVIASAIEEFKMPNDLVGVVHDKSTWARRGLSVFNTVIEPGWKGFLTLELVYHGSSDLTIPAGAGIAQVIFQRLSNKSVYVGKYQNQEDRPVSARES